MVIVVLVDPRRRNVTSSMVGFNKKTLTYAKISPNMVNPQILLGTQKKK